MGAYGSPDLYPPEKNTNNFSNPNRNYQSYIQIKPKRRWPIFILGFICGIIFFILYTDAKIDKNVASIKANTPVYSSATPPSSISNEYLVAWAKEAVAKGLLYPDTAKFSDNMIDWSFITQGNVCTVNSFVWAKDKSNQLGMVNFEVKFTYSDLQAKVIYLSIGNHVSYDASLKN